MNIFKFRVVVDMEEDIFRDIEIATDSKFLELHEAILRAFDFEEGEMASFYMSNDTWERGEEVTLMDVDMEMELELDEEAEQRTPSIKAMKETALETMLSHPDDKVIYVYDFLRMWCFYIELVEIKKAAPSTLYPRISLVYGTAPDQKSKEIDLFGDLDLPADGGGETYKTGDPELDAYLDDDGDEGQSFTSLDNLDDDLY